MQAPLAIIGSLLGVLAWWTGGGVAFLVGGTLLLGNWPWTIFVMMPTNRGLMATKLENAGPHTRALIVKWNVLHSVRTVLGCLAVLASLFALFSH